MKRVPSDGSCRGGLNGSRQKNYACAATIPKTALHGSGRPFPAGPMHSHRFPKVHGRALPNRNSLTDNRLQIAPAQS